MTVPKPTGESRRTWACFARRWLLFVPDRSPLASGLNALAATLLLCGLLALAFHQLTYHWQWRPILQYRAKFWLGFLTTIGLSLGALVGSTILGLLVATLRRSSILLLRALGRGYVELVRGTPLLVQILIAFYVVAESVGIQNRYVVGVAALSVFTGAYLAEIFRAGLESISQSQWESARAVGFRTTQIYRYVVLPQALRHVLPPVAGQFSSLIKDSSLLSVIAVSELTLNAQEVNSNVYGGFEGYLVMAAGYLLLTLPISLWIHRLEARHHYET